MPKKSFDELAEEKPYGWLSMYGQVNKIKYSFVFCPQHNGDTITAYFINWKKNSVGSPPQRRGVRANINTGDIDALKKRLIK